ncbi:MAG: Do family serine endopeptidase [Proteobacteria bacterium]|nr:Do family serine endopeptidase [Pseudomonadota bacterium]
MRKPGCGFERPGRAPEAALVALALLAAHVPPAEAQKVPESRAEIRLSFAPVVKRAAPAVVNIYARTVVRERAVSPLFDDPFFRRFFGEGLGLGIPRERVRNSLGSGVIVAPEGLIVTNNHVIEGASEVTVVLADRREFEARIVGSDPHTDLAVLRIDAGGEALPFLEMRDSEELEVGDLVLAIGNPFGVGQTVTSGIVSALARTQVGVSDFRFFIQTDAAINPGNSGGALVDMDGRLVGVNTAIFSKTGGSLGIGFAIPANMVGAVVKGLVSGRLVRPWLGASTQAVTAEMAASLGLPRPGGVIVKEVFPGGPAERARLRTGDVIAEINGRPVQDPEALAFRIATLPVGESARLSLLSRGARREATLPLEAPPEIPPREIGQLSGEQPFSGATVANLSPALGEELGIDPMRRGVIVLEVRRGGIADRLGVAPGDIVVEVNGQTIASVKALKGALAERPALWRLSLRRGDRVINLQVRG